MSTPWLPAFLAGGMKILLVDDMRSPAPSLIGHHDWTIVRTSKDYRFIYPAEPWEMLLLDHDLGGADNPVEVTREHARLVEQGILPEPRFVVVVSANPVARQRLMDPWIPLLGSHRVSWDFAGLSLGLEA